MPKRTLFTNITALPAEITREVAVAMLHDHDEMIALNPLVIENHPIKTPRDAPADEFLDCVWQQLTDKIHYLPGGIVKGKVSYKACFHDLPLGLQTHIYAPLGLDIREKWSIGGTLPGEPPEPRELGIAVPAQGLYLREDGDMHCSRFLTNFVRKNLDQSHKVLVERILKKAQRIEQHRETMSHQSYQTSQTYQSSTSNPHSLPSTNLPFQSGSHMAKSRIINSPLLNHTNPPLSPTHMTNHAPVAPNLLDHPAFRDDARHPSWSSQTATANNSYLTPARQSSIPNLSSSSSSAAAAAAASINNSTPTTSKKQQFIAELPGSYYHARSLSQPGPDYYNNRYSQATELSSQDMSSNHLSLTPAGQSDRGSVSNTSDQAQQHQSNNNHNGLPPSPINASNGYRYSSRQEFGKFQQQQSSQQAPQQPFQPYQDDIVTSKGNRISELPAMSDGQVQRLR